MKKIILLFTLLGFICTAQAQTATECFYKGVEYGEAENYTQAVYWFRKAAEQGVPNAQYNLGICYYNGKGVEKNFTQAVYWYRKAAEQGIPEAQYNLGRCYYKGEGVEKNFTQAVYWYRKAAEQGDDMAQNNLGNCYYKGEGVEKNFTQAVYWYRKSAEQAYPQAQNTLGDCYWQGEGVEKNESTALYWYKQAAAGGSASAQYQLAATYRFGWLGVAEDGNTALYWYEKAAKNEDDGLNELGVSLAESGIKSLKEEGYSSSRSKLKIEDIVRLQPKKEEKKEVKQAVSCDACSGSGRDKCNMCSGSGKTVCTFCNATGYKTCTFCNSTGRKQQRQYDPYTYRSWYIYIICPACNGRGKTPCSICNTTGKRNCYYCAGQGSSLCSACSGAGKTYKTVVSSDTPPKSTPAEAAPAQETAEEIYQRCLNPHLSNELVLKYMKKSAEMGYAPAMSGLGNCYKSGGLGVTKDGNIAIYWYERALTHKSELNEETIKSIEKALQSLKEDGLSSAKAKTATAKIEKVWAEQNVLKNGVKGMNIHVKFTVSNMKNKSCEMLAEFEAEAVDNIRKIKRISTLLTPASDNGEYSDFILFVGYDNWKDLNHSNNRYNLNCRVEIKVTDATATSEKLLVSFNY